MFLARAISQLVLPLTVMKILEEEEVGEGIKGSLLGLKFEVIMREPSEDVRRL